MEINQEKCTLRLLRQTDDKELAAVANNINVWNNLRDTLPHPYTPEDARNFINICMAASEPSVFGIIVDNKVAGTIGFTQQKDVQRYSAEIGYWLGEEFWGRGIATQALNNLTSYIFRETDIVRLFGSVFDFNTASIRVLEKAGFEQIGICHKGAFKNGRFSDFYLYEKIR